MRTVRHPSLLLITFAVTACATGGGGDGTARRDPSVITVAELADFLDRPVYEAVSQLRPQWLTPRGNVSLTTSDNRLPSVILDGVPNRLDILESMRPEEVETLRLINAADATMRYGTGYPNGAILVTTRRR